MYDPLAMMIVDNKPKLKPVGDKTLLYIISFLISSVQLRSIKGLFSLFYLCSELL